MTKKEPETEKTDEIQIDIFKNRLVPGAKVLSEDEIKALLGKYNITKQQLPRISSSDSVSKVLKVKHGDIIEFDRKTPIGGFTKYYRLVVGGGT
jgi:DNA-directed RNA polymerase subunit H (RpoH/RPB5)